MPTLLSGPFALTEPGHVIVCRQNTDGGPTGPRGFTCECIAHNDQASQVLTPKINGSGCRIGNAIPISRPAGFVMDPHSYPVSLQCYDPRQGSRGTPTLKPLFNYDFGKRVILDTNTLLNATFNSGGLAAHTLSVLRKKSTPIYVTPSIEAEVRRVSDRLTRKYGLGYDPAQAVLSSLRTHGILFAPAPQGPPLAHINRADEPIARAAKQLGAAIITDDIEFIVEARAAGVDAWQYWEVSRSYRGDGELPDLARIVRYGAPAGAGAYIFARATPGGWAGLRIDQQYTVCEIEDGLWLYYDGLSERWQVRTPDGAVVGLLMPLKPDFQYVVGVNVRPADMGNQIVLMAAELGGHAVTAKADVGAVARPNANSRLNVGHSRRQLDNWGGPIMDLVVASGGLPPRTFRLLASTEDLSPNPSDSDKLEQAVQRVIVLVS